jgi:hypothetical protein
MDKQTRVEKYKKYRESIQDMSTYNNFNSPYQVSEDDPDKNDVGMSEEVLQDEHIKKNTLSISIDQIVKAHDEYTTMISQEDIEKKNKEEKKLQLHKLIYRIAIITGVVVIVSLIVIIIVLILKKGV